MRIPRNSLPVLHNFKIPCLNACFADGHDLLMNMIKNADNAAFHHGNHLISGISGSDYFFLFKIAPMREASFSLHDTSEFCTGVVYSD